MLCCAAQNTTRSLLEYSAAPQGAAGSVAAAEPEFHSALDMGKVRLKVSAPGGSDMIVPCDHRQTVAEVTEKIQQRAGTPVVALAVRCLLRLRCALQQRAAPARPCAPSEPLPPRR